MIENKQIEDFIKYLKKERDYFIETVKIVNEIVYIDDDEKDFVFRYNIPSKTIEITDEEGTIKVMIDTGDIEFKIEYYDFEYWDIIKKITKQIFDYYDYHKEEFDKNFNKLLSNIK